MSSQPSQLSPRPFKLSKKPGSWVRKRLDVTKGVVEYWVTTSPESVEQVIVIRLPTLNGFDDEDPGIFKRFVLTNTVKVNASEGKLLVLKNKRNGALAWINPLNKPEGAKISFVFDKSLYKVAEVPHTVDILLENTKVSEIVKDSDFKDFDRQIPYRHVHARR